MKVLRQARRLVRAGGCAALALGMAGAAGAVSAPAQARVTRSWSSPLWRRAGATTRRVSWVTGFAARLGNGVSATGGFATVLGTDGTVWAWGDDSAGQLGNARSSIPVTRPVNTIGAGSGITQLSAGDFHVLALKSNGTALAWGSNGSGQLGNGSTTDPAGPVLVTGLANATQVAAGERFSLAVHTVPYLLGS